MIGSAFPYEGPDALRGLIDQALRRVVDPEVAMNIVDLGLPAVAGVKLQFGALFYLPLAVLHVSLAARLGRVGFDPASLARGAAWNAGAIVLFALTAAGAAMTWRRHDLSAATARELGRGAPP